MSRSLFLGLDHHDISDPPHESRDRKTARPRLIFCHSGLDDFFCITAKAGVYASLNQGGSPPKFKSIGMIVPESDREGREVRMAGQSSTHSCPHHMLGAFPPVCGSF